MAHNDPEDDEDRWWLAGACRGKDPNIFFIERFQRADAARAICKPCPVRQTCLDTAIEEGDMWAVRGGLTAQQRRPLIAAYRRQLREAS
jgi:WhiB family redox-sensing transcriptional regulator